MVKTLCIVCRGSKNIRCPTCEGAGFTDDVVVGADGSTDSVCAKCGGNGSIKCPEYRGKGDINHV